MSGSVEGGKKAAITNKAKYGESFYKRIGADGGKASSTGGFYYAKQHGMDDKIREAGRKGGKISRRGPNPNGMELTYPQPSERKGLRALDTIFKRYKVK